MEIGQYFDVLIRWAWVIVLVTAVCTASTMGYGRLQTPRYTSSVEVSVAPARLNLDLSQTVINLLRNYVSAIQSEHMASRVIQRLGLVGVESRMLATRIEAESVDADFKITIGVTDNDPIVAQREAQAAAELFADDVKAFADRQDPLDRLTATILNGGAQPAGKTWPRNKLLAFAGLGGGLVAGLLLALALEWSRVEVVQTAQQAEELLGLTVLGSVPGNVRESRRRRLVRGPDPANRL